MKVSRRIIETVRPWAKNLTDQFSAKVPICCISDEEVAESIRFYDTSSIDVSGTYLAVTQYPEDNHLPSPGDPAYIIVRDLRSGKVVWKQETLAWDTQLGAQVQWHPLKPVVYFNLLDEQGHPIGASYDMCSGELLYFPWTVYMVSFDGRFSVSADLRKIGQTQAGYGVHVPESEASINMGASNSDGVYIQDLEKGTVRLLITIEELIDRSGIEIEPNLDFYVFHVKWSPDGKRVMVVLRAVDRYTRTQKRWVLSCDTIGENVHILVEADLWARGGHHPNWHPDSQSVVMNLVPELQGKMEFCIIGDRKTEHLTSIPEAIGSGHPTIDPTKKYILSDAYLSEPMAHDDTVPLRWINMISGKETELARVPSKPKFSGPKNEWRVDPHPAWCMDGAHITFNAWVNERRCVCLADLSSIMD